MKEALKSIAAVMMTLTLLVAVSIGVAAFVPPVGLAPALPALNTAGDAVYASAQVSDGTGVVTTVTTAGTYVTVGTASPLAAAESDGSGCITYTLASNQFTIASSCGVGEVLLRACLNDVVGTESAVVLGAWHRVRSATTTVAGPIVRETETATTPVRNQMGCVEVIVDAQLNDTYDFRYDSDGNGDTVTTRQAFFSARKLLNK
jgi:hypothetical protein